MVHSVCTTVVLDCQFSSFSLWYFCRSCNFSVYADLFLRWCLHFRVVVEFVLRYKTQFSISCITWPTTVGAAANCVRRWLTDAVAMVTQEAELNELRATIELLRQQGHAQLSPLRRPTLTVCTPHKDVSSNGQLTRSYYCWVLLYFCVYNLCLSLTCFFVLALALQSSFLTLCLPPLLVTLLIFPLLTY